MYCKKTFDCTICKNKYICQWHIIHKTNYVVSRKKNGFCPYKRYTQVGNSCNYTKNKLRNSPRKLNNINRRIELR